MPRPRLQRRVRFSAQRKVFKPLGVPLKELETVDLSSEEVEALRLKNVQELSQEEAAKKMQTSQSTFQRILSSAYKKISDAIINGKGINLS